MPGRVRHPRCPPPCPRKNPGLAQRMQGASSLLRVPPSNPDPARRRVHDTGLATASGTTAGGPPAVQGATGEPQQRLERQARRLPRCGPSCSTRQITGLRPAVAGGAARNLEFIISKFKSPSYDTAAVGPEATLSPTSSPDFPPFWAKAQ